MLLLYNVQVLRISFLDSMLCLPEESALHVFRYPSPKLLPGSADDVTMCGFEFDVQAKLVMLIQDASIRKTELSKMSVVEFRTVDLF